MTWKIIGTRADLVFGVGSVRSVMGRGTTRVDEGEDWSPAFSSVLDAAGHFCEWSMAPHGKETLAMLTLDKRDKRLTLTIRWPEEHYRRAERILDQLFLSPDAKYSITLPLLHFHAGIRTPDEPMTYGEFMSGQEYQIPAEGVLPLLLVGLGV